MFAILSVVASTIKKTITCLPSKQDKNILFSIQQESFNGQSTNFSGGGYSYNQGNGVSFTGVLLLDLTRWHL